MSTVPARHILTVCAILSVLELVTPPTSLQAAEDSRRLVPPIEEGGTPAPSLPSLPAPKPDQFRDFYGYQGPHFRHEDSQRTVESQSRVSVLDQTLRTSPSGNWKVAGLVRNDTPIDVHLTGIHATLRDSRTVKLATATADIFLNDVRPGEPVPFVIAAGVSSDRVSSVEWSVTYAPSIAHQRMLRITRFWQLPFGDRQRHAGYPTDDPPARPFPLIVFGSIQNASSASARKVRVLGAWFDDEGRVVHVDWLSLLSGADYAHRHSSLSLAPGQSEDFLYENADPVLAPELTKGSLALWGLAE